MTDADGTSATLRYAVLHHTGHGPPHYDLLFETSPGSPLLTFRSPVWPVTGEDAARRLPDHRPMYLDYEGPVSGGRGGARWRGGRATHGGSDIVVTFRTGADHPPLPSPLPRVSRGTFQHVAGTPAG